MRTVGSIKKHIICVVLAMAIVICLPTSMVSAYSYQYNESEEAIAAPDGYEPVCKVRSSDIMESESWSPTDIFIDSAGEIHLLDQENGCIYVFDTELNFKRKVVFKENGEEAFLANLNGVCVKRDNDIFTYFVADTDNKRVFFADMDGNILRSITKPDTVAFNEKTTFAPTKVSIDSNDNLYVLSAGVYQGVVVFSAKENYSFMTFLGGNTVESTATLLADYFWKQIFNKKQKASMRRYVPVSIANFTIDAEDHLYTVTNKSSKGTKFENEIKKYSAKNVNVLKNQDWGDLELAYDNNNLVIDTSYIDISVENNGILAALDGNLCRVSVFTSQGDRLFTFGENNKTDGNFDTPAAIEMKDDNIYVVDSNKQSITKFSPNDYGALVLKAARLYANGEYDKAFPLWQEVKAKNGACLLADVAMGKQYMAEKNYKKAMSCFRDGADRESYSEAFSLQRSINLQKLFPLLAAVLIIAFIGLLVLDSRLKNKARKVTDPVKKKIPGQISYMLFHPCEGGIQLARKAQVSKTVIASAIIVTVWFLASISKWCFSGFIFNTNIQTDFNILLQLAKTFGLFILWIVSMQLVSNLMDSSARFTDIIIVTSVALIPYISSLFLYSILSNFLSLDEATYLTVIQVCAIIWSFAILLGGFREINEMSFSKTVLCIIFTILGMALVIFMLILLFSLFQQFISFAAQILIELKKMIV